MKEDYAMNDEVWIYAGETSSNGTPKLSKGKVEAAIKMPGRALIQYLILLDDPNFLHMEVRDAYLMTDDPDVLPPVTNIRWPRKKEGYDVRLQS